MHGYKTICIGSHKSSNQKMCVLSNTNTEINFEKHFYSRKGFNVRGTNNGHSQCARIVL
jgi:hypothetical protein